MRIAMINGSPKAKDSTSGALLEDLQKCISSDLVIEQFHFIKPEIDETIASKLNSCDVWVFSFPLYVDGIPSHLLSCLCQIEEMSIDNKNIRVFAIVNSGFYEGIQNAIAIQILKNFCVKLNLKWGMGIGVGGGGSLAYVKSVPLGKGPKTSLGKAFKTLADNLNNNNSFSHDSYLSVDFPRLFYKISAEMGWKQMIKKNGKAVKDLSQRL